jgi:tRNA/rRNA methyltransferase
VQADVLASARVVATLDDALDDLTFVAATAMTPRDFGPPTWRPRDLFGSLAAGPHRVGFLFGSERSDSTTRRCISAMRA